MDVYIIGVFASILLYVVVGNYAGRKVRHLDDYFVAGRNAPTLLIVGTLVASFLSTNAFLAETGFAYNGYAFLMLVLVMINTTGYVLGALFFGRFVRRSRALTLPEYFGKRFDSFAVRRVAGITIILGISAYLLAVTQGAALIVSELVDIPYGASLFIVWLGYTAFTLYSGSRGVVLTDTLMFLLFTVVAFLAVPFVVSETAGSWTGAITQLATYEPKPGIIAWHGLTGAGAYWGSPLKSLLWAVILGVAWAGVLAISPWQTSRYLMARSEHVVLRSACLAGGVLALLYIVLMVTGASINLANADIEVSERAIIWAAFNLMPTWLGVLTVAGVMAAALSSCSTFLSLVGFSVTNDLVRGNDTDDRRLLRISRYVMLAVGLVALATAYFQPPAIMWITYFAGTLFASSWGAVALMSIWSRRITAAAAFWGMILGFAGNIGAKLLDHFGVVSLPVYLDPFIIGTVLSISAILLVSARTRVTETERRYQNMLFVVPADAMDPVTVRRTLVWPKALMVTGVATSLFLVFWYARPYTAALAQ